MNLLFISDSPCKETGFGRISNKLLENFSKNFNNIYVWAFGHIPTPHNFQYLILEGNPNNTNWRSEDNLNRLENFINCLPNPLTIILQGDPFRLYNLIPLLKRAKNFKEITIITYAAIDSFLMNEDVQWLKFSDKIAVYSEFAKEVSKNFDFYDKIEIISPGVDNSFFDLKVDRREFFQDLSDEDFLFLYVNSNNPKKSPQTTIDIFKRILQITKSNKFKLYLHTPSSHPFYNLNLKEYCYNIGLTSKSVYFSDSFFTGLTSLCDSSTLNKIYNCANLFISSSGSEGFGLTPCEASKTMLPVATPNHTSLKYLFDTNSAIILPSIGYFFDEFGRMHNRIDIDLSARLILFAIESGVLNDLAKKSFENISKYSWESSLQKWNNFLKK